MKIESIFFIKNQDHTPLLTGSNFKENVAFVWYGGLDSIVVSVIHQTGDDESNLGWADLLSPIECAVAIVQVSRY